MPTSIFLTRPQTATTRVRDEVFWWGWLVTGISGGIKAEIF